MTMALTTTANETWKGPLLSWGYRFNMVTELFMLGVVFVGIDFFMGNGELQPDRLAIALVGYLTWFYAIIVLNGMGNGLAEEAQSGTLEQLYMSPTPAAVLLIGRVASTLIVSTVMVAIVGLGLVLLLRITIPVGWQWLPVFGLTLLGLLGMGYASAGATIVFKRTASLTNMLTNIMLFLNGALLPVDRLPEWLEVIAKVLPTTLGIIAMRRVIFDGESLASLWSDGTLVLLAAHSTVFVLLGWLGFRYAQGVAKRKGLLGQY